jgi:hypothetical protein
MKCITKLLKENNEEVTDQNEILNYEESFYKTLYSEPEKDIINASSKQKLQTSLKTKHTPK